jgi:hypothetical protein
MMQAIDRLVDKEVKGALRSRRDARDYVYARIVAAGVSALTDFNLPTKKKR